MTRSNPAVCVTAPPVSVRPELDAADSPAAPFWSRTPLEPLNSHAIALMPPSPSVTVNDTDVSPPAATLKNRLAVVLSFVVDVDPAPPWRDHPAGVVIVGAEVA